MRNDDARHTLRTLGVALRKAGAEWAKEYGPITLVVLGLCFSSIGAIQYAEGTRALANDEYLRTAGEVTTGEIIEVDSYQRNGYRPGTRSSTVYIPITRQIVDGTIYETRLSDYEVSNDRDFYQIGDTLPVMYDPANPAFAGIEGEEYPAMFRYQIDSGRNVGIPGAVAFVIGIPFWGVHTVRSIRTRIVTRETRKWAKARRRVRRARRAARRAQPVSAE
ncbi:MAG TPA: DUF3592 domain-containing protein [Glaciihabitans sp.]|jgi:hypothetical protein|nr:DUF3592 domain-containing protein [Glaciihabitans sp.]